MIIRIMAMFATLQVVGAVDSIRHLMENGDSDLSWMKDYQLTYEDCFDNMVAFRLCPLQDWRHMNCSEYFVTDISLFLHTYVMASLDNSEKSCEDAIISCEFESQRQCYEELSDDACLEFSNFNLREFMDCTPISDDYFVAPYCSNVTRNIHMGVFGDDMCTTQVSRYKFYDVMHYDLPFTKEKDVSLIYWKWIDCNAPLDDDDDDDDDNSNGVLEQCLVLYDGSTNCETEMDSENPYFKECAWLQEHDRTVVDLDADGPRNHITSSTRMSFWGGVLLAAVFVGTGGFALYYYSHHQRRREYDLVRENP